MVNFVAFATYGSRGSLDISNIQDKRERREGGVCRRVLVSCNAFIALPRPRGGLGEGGGGCYKQETMQNVLNWSAFARH